MIKILLLLPLLLSVSCQKNTENKLFDEERQTKVEPTQNPATPKDPNFTFITKEPSVSFLATARSSLRKRKAVKLNLKTIKVDFDRTLGITGVIGPNILGIADAIKKLSSISNEPIYILIDSPGGSVFDGARVVAAMQNSKAPIHTICMRFCASMAFIIHQYGTKRYMLDRTILMSHFASAGTSGDVKRMASFIAILEEYTQRFSKEIAHRAGLSLERYLNMISKDLWMSEKEALNLKFSDGTVNVAY